MAIRIEVGEGESIGKALRRFKRLCDCAGVGYRLREHEYRRKPCEERRRKLYRAKIQACKVAYLKRLELGLAPAKER